MVTINIIRVQQIIQRKITVGHTKRFSKKVKSFVIHRYSINTLRINSQYNFFSVHAHGYHANLGEHGNLAAKWYGQSESI